MGGIKVFDTGHSYGKAEERIGKVLNELSINRSDIVISTKFGTRIIDGKYVHDTSIDWVQKSVELSMQRMNIDYIDILYIHGPQINDLNDGLLNLLDSLKKQGIIRATGANTFDTDVIDYITDNRCLDVVMLDYNIVKQNRESQIKRLYDSGIGVVAGQAMAESVFLNDLFKIKSKKDLWYLARTFGRKASRDLFFESQKYRFLNHLDGWDGSQVALKYVVDNPYISTASIGTCNPEHLKKNIEALNIEIPDDLIKKIKATK